MKDKEYFICYFLKTKFTFFFTDLEQGMATLLSWIKTNKTLKHLSIGRNFENLKQK